MSFFWVGFKHIIIRGVIQNPWASTIIKIMVDPISMIKTLREAMVVILTPIVLMVVGIPGECWEFTFFRDVCRENQFLVKKKNIGARPTSSRRLGPQGPTKKVVVSQFGFHLPPKISLIQV